MYGDGGFYFLQPVSADATYGGIDMLQPQSIRRVVRWSGASPVYAGPEYNFHDTSGGGSTRLELPTRSTGMRSAGKPKQQKPKQQKPKPGARFTIPRARQGGGGAATTGSGSSTSTVPPYDPYAQYTTPDYLPESENMASSNQPYFTTYDTEKSAASLPTGEETSGGVMAWIQDNKIATGAIVAAAGLAGWMLYKNRMGR